MLARNDIHRSIAKMTIDLHQAARRRANRAVVYGIGEREVQYQYDFSGKIGTLPAEGNIDIPFGITFLADAGNARDSSLDRPVARLAMELLSAPEGMMHYAHIVRWHQDDDFNYTGVVVKIGVHCPAMIVGGFMPTQFDFRGILHAAFQGYGAPWDADQPDGGGLIDTSQDWGVG